MKFVFEREKRKDDFRYKQMDFYLLFILVVQDKSAIFTRACCVLDSLDCIVDFTQRKSAMPFRCVIKSIDFFRDNCY